MHCSSTHALPLLAPQLLSAFATAQAGTVVIGVKSVQAVLVIAAWIAVGMLLHPIVLRVLRMNSEHGGGGESEEEERKQEKGLPHGCSVGGLEPFGDC